MVPGMRMDNRANILSCALQLFAARGYDAVSVKEVVDAAGVTKPTLYHYFGSKRGLLDALLAERFAELYQVIEEAATYRGDLPLTLNRVATTYFRYAKTHPLFYRMQLSMWFAPPDSDGYKAVSSLNIRQQQILEELFIQAADDHGNMRGRHRAYAATLLGMINTYVGLALNEHVELDDTLAHRAVHQYMHGIFS
jgi:AcrR family transcriptional regulator